MKLAKEVYDSCITDGLFIHKKNVDIHLIESLLNSAEQGLERSKISDCSFEKRTNNYSFLFAERYDILRKLIDAVLLLNKLQISNHQCSNAYLCVKQKSLQLNWNKLEDIRIIRNEINYKGRIIKKQEWESNKNTFEKYIQLLMDNIKPRLNQKL